MYKSNIYYITIYRERIFSEKKKKTMMYALHIIADDLFYVSRVYRSTCDI